MNKPQVTGTLTVQGEDEYDEQGLYATWNAGFECERWEPGAKVRCEAGLKAKNFPSVYHDEVCVAWREYGERIEFLIQRPGEEDGDNPVETWVSPLGPWKLTITLK